MNTSSSLATGDERAFHVHVCPASVVGNADISPSGTGSSPEDASAYERLKRELAERHPRIYSYADAKGDFVRAIEAKAAASVSR